MERYKNFNPARDNNKEDKLEAPPVIKEEILASGLTFKGRNGQEYGLTIFKGGRFRICYPEYSFLLKEGSFDEDDLVVKMGAEPSFYTWVKIMLNRHRES